MEKINNSHDLYFKEAMSDLRVAKDFLQQHLPDKVLAVTDLSTLRIEKDSYLSKHAKQLMSDMLYRVTMNSNDGYIYVLVEHQSTPDRMMPFRLLRYTCEIIARHIKNLTGKTLPVVVPLVFYHGQRTYPYSTDIFDLFGKNKELAKNSLLKPFVLVDVGGIPDEDLKGKTWAGVFEFIQKHIHTRDFLSHISEMVFFC